MYLAAQSKNIRRYKINVYLLFRAGAYVHFPEKTSYHVKQIIRHHFQVTTLNYKQFAVFLKMIRTNNITTCVKHVSRALVHK